MLIYILFVLGFVFLIQGAKWLVDGAASIAKGYNISNMIVGLTIVSFGTSMPELIVNLVASFNSSPSIALGNVLGSNIANILLILGAAAVVCPLPLQRNTVRSEIPFSIMAALLVGFLANAALVKGEELLMLSRIDGTLLLFFFVLFMTYIFTISSEQTYTGEEEYKIFPISKSILLILAGIAGLYFGGEWVVNGAIQIARKAGLSETLIGLTIVAIGTSLPELVTSVVAAQKKSIDIAVGNIVGSNIFNLLWILGISAVIKPLPFERISNMDILWVIGSSVMIFVLMVLYRKHSIGRRGGVLFLLLYGVYLYYIIHRG